MSPAPPPLNPSQAVERIREIIVGRHLERLEHRVDRLEQAAPAAGAPSAALENRIIAAEAKLEALRENVRRSAEVSRGEQDLHAAALREETQRLAAQIQQIAAHRPTATPAQEVLHLERKIGNWLGQWQSTVNRQFEDRDHRLVAQIRGEAATLWEATENQITRLESRCMDRAAIEERFRRIAAAARALAESAMPPVPGSTQLPR